MSEHLMKVSVNSKEFEELIEELGEISNRLYHCANKAMHLCGLSIDVADKEEAASGN